MYCITLFEVSFILLTWWLIIILKLFGCLPKHPASLCGTSRTVYQILAAATIYIFVLRNKKTANFDIARLKKM